MTIVEIAEFQCPFCARVEHTLEAIVANYGNNVRIVWKNNPLPFHPRAEPAAELAMEARAQKGDKGFWAAHDCSSSGVPGRPRRVRQERLRADKA